MQYITQHRYKLRNQPFIELQGLTVLLVEPEPETRSFYRQQLSDIEMNVVLCDNLQTMQVSAEQSSPDVVIVNPSLDVKTGINLVRALRREFPSLPIITMAMTMPDTTLDAIMESGVSLHINRGLTRPRDLLLALEQVIATK